MMLSIAFLLGAIITGNADLGRHLYAVHCISCHGSNLQGSLRAPALITTDAAMVDFQLRTGRMPAQGPYEQEYQKPPQLPGDQIRALEAYISSRSSGSKDVPQPSPVPSSVPRTALIAGREVYEEQCEQCHAATARGEAAVAYRDVAPSLMDTTPATIQEAVREGPAPMPVFGKHVVTDEQLAELTAYVHYLQTADYNPGGLQLANWGPVSEGFVAWIAGIGALMFLARRIGEG